ncbi:MAG: hypothetical protein GTN68_31620 [Candidatus Aminicenantes bacterium]|nr:hypothetical protein [Candidatus Aminicenantes bacterium]
MEWHKGYGTENGEHIHEIMQTRDGGYIGIGQVSEGRRRGADILVVKIDSAGEFMWQKIIGTKNKYDIGICVDEAEDGFVIGGGLFDGNQQRYMAKLDYDGEMIWQHVYENDGNGMIRGIDILINGDIVTTGYKNSSQPGYVFIADDSDGFILKTDVNGIVIWEKPISAPQGAKVRKEINNEGFVICTTIWMNHPEHPEDFYLIKTDEEGNEYWSKNYGGDSDEHCYDFDLTKDGGYILGGHTRSPLYGVVNWDFLMMKIDSEGNEEWHKTFGQPRGYDPNYIHDEAYGIRQTHDGGYVIVGGTGDEYEYSESGSPFGDSDVWQVYVVKVNSEGELFWQAVYGSPTENDAGEYLGLTHDGGYIIGTDTDSAGKEKLKPNNFGFMKLGK